MKARFFERDGVLFVAVKTDASTEVELLANDKHKARYSSAYAQFAGSDNSPSVDINKMSKDELEALAREKFDVELDKRKKISDLRAEVSELLAG